MKNRKNIIFAGDSFTWGEGLDLYMDTPFWIEQREKDSDWPNLQYIITEESDKFRETYRWSTAVANYFDCDSIVRQANGGGFHDGLSLIDEHKSKNTIAVVFQFTNIFRMNLHLRPDKCHCKYCRYGRLDSSVWGLVEAYYNIVNSHINDNKEASSVFWKNIEFLKMHQTNPYPLLTYREWEKLSSDDKESWLDKFTRDIVITFDKEYRRNLNELAIYFQKLEREGIHVLLIDSWDTHWTKRMILENEYLMSKLIPLVGQNTRLYKSWNEWCNSFHPYRILDEYPKTNNHHPSMTSNILLYKSVVKELNKHFGLNKKLDYYDNLNFNYDVKRIETKPLI